MLRTDDNGDELFLYHIKQGETCAIRLNCCMGHTRSEIHAATETTVKLIMIPVAKMEEWSSRFKSWRNFIFNSYHNKMKELLESIDKIAFHNLEERLEMYLIAKSNFAKDKHLTLTHKQIAADLNTSRVVISRLLKKMEREEILKLHRGSIELM